MQMEVFKLHFREVFHWRVLDHGVDALEVSNSLLLCPAGLLLVSDNCSIIRCFEPVLDLVLLQVTHLTDVEGSLLLGQVV